MGYNPIIVTKKTASGDLEAHIDPMRIHHVNERLGETILHFDDGERVAVREEIGELTKRLRAARIK